MLSLLKYFKFPLDICRKPAAFLKPDEIGSNSDLYDCKIIERREPEDVETDTLMTAATTFD